MASNNDVDAALEDLQDLRDSGPSEACGVACNEIVRLRNMVTQLEAENVRLRDENTNLKDQEVELWAQIARLKDEPTEVVITRISKSARGKK